VLCLVLMGRRAWPRMARQMGTVALARPGKAEVSAWVPAAMETATVSV